MGGQIPANTRATRKDGPDYFPTPPWATRALCERLAHRLERPLKSYSVWEPACGAGYMARPLGEYFGEVFATDLIDHSATWPAQDGVLDFLLDWPGDMPGADFIVTNPPFNVATDFISLALKRARIGVAMFVKIQFLEGVTRHRRLFSRDWPWLILQFAERVPLCAGRVDPDAATNQAYTWIIWLTPEFREALTGTRRAPPTLEWLEPCRKRLEAIGDYPTAPAPAPEATPLINLMES